MNRQQTTDLKNCQNVTNFKSHYNGDRVVCLFIEKDEDEYDRVITAELFKLKVIILKPVTKKYKVVSFYKKLISLFYENNDSFN